MDDLKLGGKDCRRLSNFPRYEQTFPTLTPAEIDRLRRFGEIRRFADGVLLFETGRPAPGMFVLLSGHVGISQRDGLGHVTPVIVQGPGQFLAEVGQLANHDALVDGRAEGEVEALLIPPAQVRALLIAEADLGERIVRALILRRVSLIQSGKGGPVLIGASHAADMVRLREFLTRNGAPHHVLDPASDAEAAALVARHATAPDDLPLVIAPDGTLLRNPSEDALARLLGLAGQREAGGIYDVAVVGAGPAGLATAVYAASEGLSVAVLDGRYYGGQAGASARIENYLGVPTGISGQALAGRAFVQAQKFGAEMMIPVSVRSLECGRADRLFKLELDNGEPLRARSIVVASGARYRRPAIANLEAFEGRGVWYWASPIEARLAEGLDVIVVGGGNSAGQACVFLAGHARRVIMVVRCSGLSASMSRCLIDRIEATANIETMFETEIIGLDGMRDGGLDQVRRQNRATGEEAVDAVAHVFLFVGADPATEWLRGCGVALDRAGFVVTGANVGQAGAIDVLQSNIAGAFAVGDVRAGSVRRVGAAIGEGAQVVPLIHAHLTRTGNHPENANVAFRPMESHIPPGTIANGSLA